MYLITKYIKIIIKEAKMKRIKQEASGQKTPIDTRSFRKHHSSEGRHQVIFGNVNLTQPVLLALKSSFSFRQALILFGQHLCGILDNKKRNPHFKLTLIDTILHLFKLVFETFHLHN